MEQIRETAHALLEAIRKERESLLDRRRAVESAEKNLAALEARLGGAPRRRGRRMQALTQVAVEAMSGAAGRTTTCLRCGLVDGWLLLSVRVPGGDGEAPVQDLRCPAERFDLEADCLRHEGSRTIVLTEGL